jgi:hypothetical protein
VERKNSLIIAALSDMFDNGQNSGLPNVIAVVDAGNFLEADLAGVWKRLLEVIRRDSRREHTRLV